MKKEQEREAAERQTRQLIDECIGPLDPGGDIRIELAQRTNRLLAAILEKLK